MKDEPKLTLDIRARLLFVILIGNLDLNAKEKEGVGLSLVL